ncbi:hypothetical protein AG1IA_05033 [Rhizoctonia solani AG-1 IA]|uniref:Uncharacterized protein n=1 Tax=Thanatephorus cucumeris (strain AG1-IA) TaxID=983506 RepID=L8WVY6_THACA|nr:hypothetical protein AG1IA_05033 [Rhizoctonia solani AG-1 IA]
MAGRQYAIEGFELEIQDKLVFQTSSWTLIDSVASRELLASFSSRAMLERVPMRNFFAARMTFACSASSCHEDKPGYPSPSMKTNRCTQRARRKSSKGGKPHGTNIQPARPSIFGNCASLCDNRLSIFGTPRLKLERGPELLGTSKHSEVIGERVYTYVLADTWGLCLAYYTRPSRHLVLCCTFHHSRSSWNYNFPHGRYCARPIYVFHSEHWLPSPIPRPSSLTINRSRNILGGPRPSCNAGDLSSCVVNPYPAEFYPCRTFRSGSSMFIHVRTCPVHTHTHRRDSILDQTFVKNIRTFVKDAIRAHPPREPRVSTELDRPPQFSKFRRPLGVQVPGGLRCEQMSTEVHSYAQVLHSLNLDRAQSLISPASLPPPHTRHSTLFVGVWTSVSPSLFPPEWTKWPIPRAQGAHPDSRRGCADEHEKP